MAAPTMSPSSIRSQLQKRLQALEATKSLYSERAKMFLGERAETATPVRTVLSKKSTPYFFESH